MKLFVALLVFPLSFVVIVGATDEKQDEETLSGIEDDWIDPHKMVDDRDVGSQGRWARNGGDNNKRLDFMGACRKKVDSILGFDRTNEL